MLMTAQYNKFKTCWAIGETRFESRYAYPSSLQFWQRPMVPSSPLCKRYRNLSVGKAVRMWSHQSTSFSSEVRNAWSYTSITPTSS